MMIITLAVADRGTMKGYVVEAETTMLTEFSIRVPLPLFKDLAPKMQ